MNLDRVELHVQDAPRFPDPRDVDQYKINRDLTEIVKLLWYRKTWLENETKQLQQKIGTLDVQDSRDYVRYTLMMS